MLLTSHVPRLAQWGFELGTSQTGVLRLNHQPPSPQSHIYTNSLYISYCNCCKFLKLHFQCLPNRCIYSYHVKVPVYNSFNFGLLESPTSDEWFGHDGLGDIEYPYPLPLAKHQQEHSGAFLARIVQEHPGNNKATWSLFIQRLVVVF